MRILLVIAVVVVFAALLVIDTAALLRLGLYCVSGGCGVPPTWIAIGGGALVLGAWQLLRRRPANVKIARVKQAAPAGKPRAKTLTRAKPKRAK
jgi:hypothetical protein